MGPQILNSRWNVDRWDARLCNTDARVRMIGRVMCFKSKVFGNQISEIKMRLREEIKFTRTKGLSRKKAFGYTNEDS